MDDPITILQREWPVISQAPWTIVSVGIACILTGWAVGRFLGGERIANLESRNQLLAAQIADASREKANHPPSNLPNTGTAKDIPGIVEPRYVSLYNAARQTFGEAYETYGKVAHAIEKGDPNEIILWFCHLLMPRITVFGELLPSEKRRVFSDCGESDGYSLQVENGAVIAVDSYGSGRWINLVVLEDDLQRVIEGLKRTPNST